MLQALDEALRTAGIDQPVGLVLADAGYWSEANATADRPDRLIATRNAHTMRRATAGCPPTVGPPPAGATAAAAVEHRLRTEAGAKAYARRQCTVEPVFDQTKSGRGFRAFTRRGLAAVDSEWKLMATTHNILKMFRHTRRTVAPPAAG